MWCVAQYQLLRITMSPPAFIHAFSHRTILPDSAVLREQSTSTTNSISSRLQQRPDWVRAVERPSRTRSALREGDASKGQRRRRVPPSLRLGLQMLFRHVSCAVICMFMVNLPAVAQLKYFWQPMQNMLSQPPSFSITSWQFGQRLPSFVCINFSVSFSGSVIFSSTCLAACSAHVRSLCHGTSHREQER